MEQGCIDSKTSPTSQQLVNHCSHLRGLRMAASTSLRVNLTETCQQSQNRFGVAASHHQSSYDPFYPQSFSRLCQENCLELSWSHRWPHPSLRLCRPTKSQRRHNGLGMTSLSGAFLTGQMGSSKCQKSSLALLAG